MSFSIQFHAMPDELIAFVNSAIAENEDVVVTAFFFPPPEQRAVSAGGVANEVHGARLRELVLTVGPPTPAQSHLEFCRNNPDGAFLSVGHLTKEGLEESCLSGSAGALATRLAAKLRKATVTGAVAVNRESGATGNLRNHRSTRGARAAWTAGTIILGPAGPRGPKLELRLISKTER